MKNWKDNLKKIMLWKPDTKAVAVIAVIVLAALLIPLYRITQYTTPWYDDYGYGSAAKRFLDLDYTLGSALQGVIYCVKTMWHAWQGTFSSIFFMALVPFIWGEQYYFLGPVFLISILAIAVFVLVKVLARDVLKADRASCIVLQVVAAILAIELMYTARAGFFWYNAGIHYVGMHSFLMLYVAVMIKLFITERKVKWIWLLPLSLLGAVLAGGANFVTSLQGIIFVVSLIGLGVLLKNKKTCLLLPSLLVYAYCFYKNVTAPGNDKRAAYYVDVCLDPATAILRSFVEAFSHLWEFTGWMTIALLVLAVPVIWQVVRRSHFEFRFPGLVLLWSFCLYATGFTPSLYSLGNAGLARTLNAVKLTYQILLLLNEVYWLGWLCRRGEKKKKALPDGKCVWWFYPIMVAVMAIIFAFTPLQKDAYCSWGAYYFVHSGIANNYYQEYLERVEELKGSALNVVLKPHAWNPWLIKMGELSEDPNHEANKGVAEWYGKESVSCKDLEKQE